MLSARPAVLPPSLSPLHGSLPLISCVETCQMFPSIALDGRFLFLADLDQGDPEPDVFGEDFEQTIEDYRGTGDWIRNIKPCWGHVKKFDFRPRPKDVKGNWRVWEEGAEAYLEE